MKSTKGTLSKHYGYGIVDKHGHPWWDEACVSQDRSPMDEQLEYLNDDPFNDRGTEEKRPYRVVKLVFEEL